MEEVLDRLLNRLSELASVTIDLVSDLFLNPAERTYWLGLVLASLIALVIGVRTDSRFDWRASLTRWMSASARVDYGLIVVKALLPLVFALSWTWGSFELARVLVHTFDQWWGVPQLALGSTGVIEHSIWVAIYSVVLFVSWDFSRFYLHRLMHRVPFLWAFHQVHHSAEVLTPFTLFRVHPVESVLYQLRGVLVTSCVTAVFFYFFRGQVSQLEVLGVGAIGFIFSLAGGNLRHSHVWWSWGPVLERWLISPAQHQMHHARANSESSNSATHSDRSPASLSDEGRLGVCNYGTWLAIWDRMFSSWRTAAEMKVSHSIRFGLEADECNHDPHSLLSSLFDPLWSLGQSALTGRVKRKTVSGMAIAFALLAAKPAKANEVPADDPIEFDALPERDADGQSSTGPESASTNQTANDPVVAESPAENELEDASENESEEFVFELDDFDEAAGESTSEADSGSGSRSDTERAELQEETGADVVTDTVSIIGDPIELPRVVGSAHQVSNEQLERHENDDIHRVLKSVPGVYIRGEDGFGLRPNIGLRGADPNRSAKVTLMEDGVLLAPAPYSAPAAYYFPLTTRLVGVEVFKGPAAVRHGPNTIGGAINLQTRSIPTQGRSGMVDLGIGMYGYAKTHAYYGRSWKRFGFLAEGARIQSTGFKELDGRKGADTGFERKEFMLKARTHGDPGARVYHQFDIKAGVSTEESNETYLGITDEDFDENPYRRYRASALGRMQWWRTQAEATYFMAAGNNFEFQTTAYRHDFSRQWLKFNRFRGGPDAYDIFANPDAGESAVYLAVLKGEEDSLDRDQALMVGTNDRRFVSQGVQSVGRIYWRHKHVDQKIEIGARLHHDEIRRLHDESAYLMQSGALVLEDAELGPQVIVKNRGSSIAGAFHLHDEITLFDRLTFSPGARLELIRTSFENKLANDLPDPDRDVEPNFDAVFLPGIGAYAELTSWLGVLAGVHSGFSPVSPGQPDEVKPERSVNYEAGFRGRYKGFKGEVVGFFNNYSNLTGECTFAQGCNEQDIGQQFNAGQVHVAGSETMLGYQHRFSQGTWFDLTATHTFTWSEFQSSFDSSNPQFSEVKKGDALPYLPLHLASLELAGGVHRFGASAALQYTGEMRDLPGSGKVPENQRIPAYLTLDLGARAWLTDEASLYLSIVNVTNSRYMVSRRPFGVRPGRPLSVNAGFKYEF